MKCSECWDEQTELKLVKIGYVRQDGIEVQIEYWRCPDCDTLYMVRDGDIQVVEDYWHW